MTARAPSSRIKAPTLVLHGDEDPLVPAGSRPHTARVIRSGGGNAEMSVVRGMGHDFPLPQIAEQIGVFCREAYERAVTNSVVPA